MCMCLCVWVAESTCVCVCGVLRWAFFFIEKKTTVFGRAPPRPPAKKVHADAGPADAAAENGREEVESGEPGAV